MNEPGGSMWLWILFYHRNVSLELGSKRASSAPLCLYRGRLCHNASGKETLLGMAETHIILISSLVSIFPWSLSLTRDAVSQVWCRSEKGTANRATGNWLPSKKYGNMYLSSDTTFWKTLGLEYTLDLIAFFLKKSHRLPLLSLSLISSLFLTC
jgi:hypothetical protein